MAEYAAVIPAEDVSAHTQAGTQAKLPTESEFQDLYRRHARPLVTRENDELRARR